MSDAPIDALRGAEDPSLRFLVQRDVLGEDPGSPGMRRYRRQMAASARVEALLGGRDPRPNRP